MKNQILRLFGLINLGLLFSPSNSIAKDLKNINSQLPKNQKPSISLKISLDQKGLIKKIQSANAVDTVGDKCMGKTKK